MTRAVPWPHGPRSALAIALPALILGAALAGAATASPLVLPTGGRVVAGKATIGTTAGFSLTIDQTSPKAIIDWSSFSIGQGDKVTFDNGSGVTLNRVMGGQVSDIDGSLVATGGVYILNPNGVVIGKNGVVNVGGDFVASSLALSNQAFLAGGDLSFTGAAGGPVTNLGYIVSASGSLELIGPNVANTGRMQATQGDVGLAGGETVVLHARDADDGRLSVLVGGAGTSAENSGLIRSAEAELKANGGDIYALAVNPGDGIEASGVSSKDGDVWLIASSGDVTAAGPISAHHADGSGALVETSGESVNFDGLKVDAGEWLIDPVTLTVGAAAAATIDANLATTNVVLQTTASSASGPGVQSPGAGDIIVGAPISWSSGKSLALDAYHSIAFDADVTVAGGGQVILKTDDGGTGGNYSFAPGASLSFASEVVQGAVSGIPGQALTVNGQAFTLVYSEAQLAAINADLTGDFALAGPLSLQGFVFTDSPIAHDAANQFTGVFEGLGNSISGLTIDQTIPEPQTLSQRASHGYVGLFGVIGTGGVVRDLAIDAARVTGGDEMAVGALAGVDLGTISNVSTSGAVTVGNSLATSSNGANAEAGGLVGYVDESGAVANSSSSATVAGGDAVAGGLVGVAFTGAKITGSNASGAVSVGSYGPELAAAGGFVGIVDGYQSGGANPIQVTLATDYATGAVTGGGGAAIGGFLGLINEGQVTTSYAIGNVTQTQPGIVNGQFDFAGGFAGVIGTGATVTQSYASGAVKSVGGPTAAWDTLAGGFVGDLDEGASVADSYALGSVSVTGSQNSLVGGFAGVIQGAASATGVYATGAVSGNGISGGLVGVLGANTTAGTLSDAYWDEGTTGTTTPYTLGSSTGSATHVVGVGGQTGRSPYAASSYAYLTFGTAPGATGWVIVDTDGSLNNAGGAAGGTRPMLLSEYATSISNAHQLQLMELDPSASYTLVGGIDASATSGANPSDIWSTAGFVSIAPTYGSPFTGSFNGGGFTISNLSISSPAGAAQTNPEGSVTQGVAGLFGVVGAQGLVENVGLVNASVHGLGSMLVGALVGANEGTVADASSSGVVSTGNVVSGDTAIAGGLVGGVVGSATVSDSNSSADVTGGTAAIVGGLVGALAKGAAISNSYATGAVSVGAASTGNLALAGGLLGYAYGYGAQNRGDPDAVSVTNSYATGAVTGGSGSVIGGFVGDVENGQISGAYATGAVTQTAGGAGGRADGIGGFVGTIVSGTISGAYSDGSVSTVGGLDSSSDTYAGGFAGAVASGASVTLAYSLTPVTVAAGGNDVAGGFAGSVGGAISQVYATGQVTGSGQLGGLVALSAAGSVTSSYWDMDTTGQSSSAGGVGLTTAQFYNASNFTGFTFGSTPGASGWVIVDTDGTLNNAGGAAGGTRPILLSEYSTSITDAHQLQLMELAPGASYTLANDFGAGETSSVYGVWNPANGFVPVGSVSAPFTGALNGQGFTISNLHIVVAQGSEQSFEGLTTDGFAGLFGVVNGPSALIEKINLSGVTVTGGEGVEVGALAGAFLQGAIQNATSSGAVTGGDALIDANGNQINAAVGGLVGLMGPQGASAAAIAASSSAAVVTAGDAFAGGLVGSTLTGSSITGSSASGAVTVGATSGAAGEIAEGGGLVGSIYGATLSNDYATGAVSGAGGSAVGGFAGYVGNSQVSASYATGSVSQAATSFAFSNYAGGFAGYVDTGSTLATSFASGAVSTVGASSAPSTFAGGFAGYLNGSVSQAYATGAVASTGPADNVGGFVGEIDSGGTANQVYATGAVTGAGSVGGLAGQLFGALSNSYWDEGTTGQTTGYVNSGGVATTVVGMGGSTGISPFEAATYAGWDFSQTWSQPSAGEYPELLGVSHVLEVVGGTVTSVYGQYPVYTYQILGVQDADIQYANPIAEAPVGATNSTSGWIDVGTYALDPSGLTAVGASGAYRSIYIAGQLTITPAPVTITLTGVVDKTYDGTTNATISQTNLELSGIVTGDLVSGTAEGGAYASKDAGTGIEVTASGLELTGADAANYTVNTTASGAIGKIDPKTLTVTLAGTVGKTYDGTTSATLSAANYELSGVIGGDSVSLNEPTSGAYATKNAGSAIDVTVSGLALTGAAAGDYTVARSASADIGNIDPKALTASLIGAVSKVYDGSTTATLTSSNYQLSGVISGDAVSLNDPTTGAYATSQVGTGIKVTATGLALSGAAAGDYTVNGAASAPIGVITAAAPTPPVVAPGQVEIQVITSVQVDIIDQPLTPPEDFAASDAAVAGQGANPTAYTVFPPSQDAAAAAAGEGSPVTGAGNGDLWAGSNLDPDQTCPSGDRKDCQKSQPNR